MEVCFITPLELEELDDNDWFLLSDFVVTIDGKELVIPQGFKTDFATVPRVPIAYWLFGNVTHKPPVIHDWLYTQGGDDAARKYADEVLYHAMLADGVNTLKAKCIYSAVRMFGKSHWTYKGVQ